MNSDGYREFPAASYDRWKTTPPDDWYGNPDDSEGECEHEDHDLDILTGRAECWRCDHRWYLSDTEMKARERQQLEYDRTMRRYGKWWFRLWTNVCRRYHEWRHPILTDDDIPF